jgi:NAD-dependent DNA ligase
MGTLKLIKCIELDKSHIHLLKLDTLKDILDKSNDKFFNGDKPLMSDEMYDYIKDFVLTEDPDYKQFVGHKVNGKKVKLPVWMGSMDKKKGNIDIDNVIISNKLDGVSCLLLKKAKKYTMYTRGDGTHGQDITYLMKHINVYGNDTHNEINSYMIRGELVLSKKNFSKLKMDASNPRNTVSGFVNSKTPNKELINKIDFIGYEVIQPKSMTPYDQLMYLQNNGFTPAPYVKANSINDTQLLQLFNKRRYESLYDIDGLVVAKNEVYTPVKKGNPNHAFAYKPSYENVESKVTTVIEVIWNISKDGYYKPTVVFEQIVINNVKINKASGFNGEFIYKNKIGKGAKISVIRSGDVIPHITNVLTGTIPDMPKASFIWSESGKDILINPKTNDSNAGNDLVKKQFEHMVLKLNFKHLGKEKVSKLYDNGITNIKQLYNTQIEKLLTIDGFSKKSAQNVLDSIKDRRKELKCIDYMIASNMFGRGFGETRFEVIISKYHPSNDKIPSKNDISSIDGLGEQTAQKYIEGLLKFKTFLNDNDLNCKKERSSSPPVVRQSNLFENENVVLTGFRDKDMMDFIINNNGVISKSVSKKTTMIIYKNKSKTYEYGITNNIRTISKEDFASEYM